MKVKLSKSMIVGLILSTASISGQAETFWMTGNITRTLAHARSFGGCMVLTSAPETKGCTWISFDCLGDFSGNGERLYTSALMAFSLDKRISAFVDNEKKVSGHCVADRVDVRTD